MQITIDNKAIQVTPGKTILDAAIEQGIEIPTLCHDPRLEPYGSCWVCIVKVEGAKGFVPACTTRLRDGMVITTMDPEIRSARRTAIELLLSNHYGDCKPPCTLACPSGIDVQGYVGLIANRKYREALELIKKNNPFPSVCGRVCPRPCEEACRRNLVDEPVAIDWLKRYVADLDLFSVNSFDPPVKPKNGKKVAVIGAGPAGLTAAYYLIQRGVSVTVYEAQSKAGGMLRYGIPDYRLPQDVLDLEIGTILRLGVELKTGIKLGEDITLEDLKTNHDAVILCLGAWKSRNLRVEGEDFPGVLQGIDFLKDVAKGLDVHLGRRVAVIGGGNTAIDAARTSLRLGVDEVSIFYRRTRKEMPASEMEIVEAIEEGVEISYLAAPVSIEGDNAGVKSVRLIKMELGEPDFSGRRRPVPIEGSEYSREIDNIIAAIGQYSDLSFLRNGNDGNNGLVDERGYIICDTDSGETDVNGVFTAGDVVTGPDIAIRAIAGGKHAALSVLDYLEKKKPVKRKEFLIKKEDLREVTPDDYKDKEKIPREKMSFIAAEKRIKSFQEIELGYNEEQALNESARCLECGCQDVHECRLKAYAEEYEAETDRFRGAIERHPIDESHPYITRDPSKCILCGRCIRICLEVQGIGVLGYVNRGFSSVVSPSFNMPFGEDPLCISCGQCVSACPVGALTEKQVHGKTVPLEEQIEEGYCSLCSMVCPVEYRYHGTLLTRVKERFNSVLGGNLCKKGRFEQGFLNEPIQDQPLGPGGGVIGLNEAKAILEKLLDESSNPFMRLSPYLAGEAIQYFLEQAEKRGIFIEPEGLGELAPGWGKLQEDSKQGRCFFEETGAGKRTVLIVGNLEETNNTAYTECLRMKSETGLALWHIGVNSSVHNWNMDRCFTGISEFAESFRQARQEGEQVDILLNPEQILSQWGSSAEKDILETLGNDVSSKKVKVTLFWNSRNAGYLLRLLALRNRVRSEGAYDLLLSVGGDDLNGADRVIRWGKDPSGAELFIPLSLSLWTKGYSEPSGRKPVTDDNLDKGLLEKCLL